MNDLLNKLYDWTSHFSWKSRTFVVMCYATVVTLVVGMLVTTILRMFPNDYLQGILQGVWFLSIWYTYLIFGKECYKDMHFDDIAKSCALGGFTIVATFMTTSTGMTNLFLFGGAGVLFNTFDTFKTVTPIFTYIGYACALACPYIILYVNRKKSKQKTFYSNKKKKLRGRE